jgi:PEGA domain-containing protein
LAVTSRCVHTGIAERREIYIHGKFFGNAPSDIALAPGEYVVRVTLGGKEWTSNVQITGGEIQLRAEIP